MEALNADEGSSLCKQVHQRSIHHSDTRRFLLGHCNQDTLIPAMHLLALHARARHQGSHPDEGSMSSKVRPSKFVSWLLKLNIEPYHTAA